MLRRILHYRSSFYNRIVQPTTKPTSNEFLSKMAIRSGFKSQPPSQLAVTRRLQLFGHVIRHPESIEHQITYHQSDGFRQRDSPYRVGHPRAHWAEVNSAYVIKRVEWLDHRPPPPIWHATHPLRLPMTLPQVWKVHGSALHQFHKNNASVWRTVSKAANDRERWKKIATFTPNPMA